MLTRGVRILPPWVPLTFSPILKITPIFRSEYSEIHSTCKVGQLLWLTLFWGLKSFNYLPMLRPQDDDYESKTYHLHLF